MKNPLLLVLLLAACTPSLPGGPGSGTPGAPQCGEDVFAPNGGLETAAAIIEPGTWSWEDDDLVLCPGAEDWFAWSVVSDCLPGFHVFWDAGAGDLDVQTWDADGNATGDLATDWDEGRTMASGDSEQGFVRIRRADGGDQPLAYRLTVSVDCLVR